MIRPFNQRPSAQVLYFAIVFVVIYLTVGGIYYEGAADSVFQTFIYGTFNNGSNALPDTFGCFTLVSYGLNFLHHYFPGFNWYDGLQLLMLFAATARILKLLLFDEQLTQREATITIILAPIIMGVFFRPVEFTKTSILISAAGLIGIYKSNKKHIVLGDLFLFSIGLLIRIEGGLLAFFIISIFFFCSHWGGAGNYKHWLTRALYTLIPIVVTCLILNLPKTGEETYYKSIRPYEYALTDFDRDKAAVTLTNAEDSAIFHGCVNFFFADSSHSNLYFFKKIGLLEFDKTPVSLVNRLYQLRVESWKWTKYLDILLSIKWLLFVWIISVIYFIPRNFIGFKVFCVNAACFLLLTMLSLWLKPEEHLIAPGIALLILLNILLLNGSGILQQTNRILLISACLVLVGLSAGEMLRQIERTREENTRVIYYNEIAKTLAKNRQDCILLNIGSWDEAHHKMFDENMYAKLNNAYVIDGAILYFNESYQHMLAQLTGSKEFIKQWEYFADKQPCIFVSSEKRMEIILHYVNTVYKKKYTAKIVHSFYSAEQGDKSLSLFRIESNNH